MKVKVSEATVKQLNWLVTGIELDREPSVKLWVKQAHEEGKYYHDYAENPGHAWPIIERMFESGLQLTKVAGQVRASLDTPNGFYYGPTPLIAALRCYVASKLGEIVEVPDALN